MPENRLFTRFIVEGEVLVHPHGQGAELVKTELVDISFKGAGVYSPKMIELNTPVKFIVSGKLFKNTIRGEGRIKYAHPWKRNGRDVFRIGIEFVDVDSDLVMDRLKFLRESLPKNQMY
ncbi:MAG: PilZ domain-containing protein [Candidatus Omnitrophica bacterium]|jgi:hypothetical protein|nr:PilZ domain-containing protein [Candidatus Omnitrophota bacterium]MDD5079579.1 PilZ domain-containing protein [Candidatus Omnitrophota bacterium]